MINIINTNRKIIMMISFSIIGLFLIGISILLFMTQNTKKKEVFCEPGLAGEYGLSRIELASYIIGQPQKNITNFTDYEQITKNDILRIILISSDVLWVGSIECDEEADKYYVTRETLNDLSKVIFNVNINFEVNDLIKYETTSFEYTFNFNIALKRKWNYNSSLDRLESDNMGILGDTSKDYIVFDRNIVETETEYTYTFKKVYYDNEANSTIWNIFSDENHTNQIGKYEGTSHYDDFYEYAKTIFDKASTFKYTFTKNDIYGGFSISSYEIIK